MMGKALLIGTYTLIALLFSNTLSAGTLDDFEVDSTSPQSKPTKQQKPSTEQSCSDSACKEIGSFLFDDITEVFIEMVVAGIMIGTETTLQRTSSDPPTAGLTPKEPGSHLLPTVRISGSWQTITPEMEIEARDLKLAAGYSLLALSYRTTQYVDDAENDSLDLTYAHGLYRLSYGNNFVLGLGYGRAELKGNNRSSGSSLSLPWIFRLTDKLYMEGWQAFSSFNQTPFTDLDYSLMYAENGAAISLGYRSVSNPVSSLSGPYIGLSYSY